MSESKDVPTLNYFAIAGRGELSRLICAVGGVKFEDKAWYPAFENGGWRQGYQAIGKKHGLPGSFPILEHGDFKLFQSNAIETYLASIAPKFKDLTAQQKAKDLMFCLVKEEILQKCEALLFQKITADDLKAAMDKMFPLLEGLLPEKGYINGLEFPTVADLCVLNAAKACMPFQASMTAAGWEWEGKFPKIERIASDAMAYPSVADFLKKSQYKTLSADPFGIMPKEYHSKMNPEAPEAISG
mmetsp:Transcript_10930/g.20066  ORF Transcript_10930/g.20066 Transcript_10930/m.20066 type:complete len:243 (-) Transcript_10930:228-956(-)